MGNIEVPVLQLRRIIHVANQAHSKDVLVVLHSRLHVLSSFLRYLLPDAILWHVGLPLLLRRPQLSACLRSENVCSLLLLFHRVLESFVNNCGEEQTNGKDAFHSEPISFFVHFESLCNKNPLCHRTRAEIIFQEIKQ